MAAEERLDAVESRWERSVPLPRPDLAFLEARLGAWPHLARRPWRVLGGGLRSLNLAHDDVVLRIALLDPAVLAKEAALLDRVADLVRVPRVLDRTEGALLLEHVPHAPLPPTEEAGAAVGAAARRLREVRFPQAGMLDAALAVAEPFETALDGLRGWAEGGLAGRAGRALGAARVAAIRARWDAHAAALAAASEAPALVHSDYKPTNVKWLPEARDVVLFDWEFAWSGPALFDAGMMLRWSPPEAFVRGLARGLAPLPADWRRTAELLDLFNLVGFLAQDGEARPRRDADVLARIDETLAR